MSAVASVACVSHLHAYCQSDIVLTVEGDGYVEGANANFVQKTGEDSIKVRTFEKGVEAETLACGTGITASALALELECADGHKQKPRVVEVRARLDNLRVEFTPCLDASGSIRGFEQVYLTGPARLIR